MLNTAYAMGTQAQASGEPNLGAGFIPVILIFIIFYFLLIRPQKNKEKQHQEMLKQLKKNDEVVTTGGIHGTIVNVKEKSVILRVSDDCRIEFQKEAIAFVKR